MKKFILFVLTCVPIASARGNSYLKGNYEEVGFGLKSFMVAYPNPDLTPGDVVADATRDTVCASGYAKKMRREVSKEDKTLIYYRYGLTYDSKHYQIDHFIPLSIGGSNDMKNLWPQPIQNNAGFIEKQQVADYLHRQVCSGAMDIHEAQAQVCKDWHAVYIQTHGGKKK